MSERANEIKKSELYNSILEIVTNLKIDDSHGDSYDHASISHELEQLFLKQKPKLFAFLYNGCIHESSYATMSLHITKEGAEKAMEAHKKQAIIEYEEYRKRHDEHLKEYAKEEGLDEDALKVLLESVGKFDDHVDWAVDEIEISD